MKKILLGIIALTLFAMGSIINAANYETTKDESLPFVQSSQSVTVWWIRNSGSLWVKTRKSGNYDSSSNKLSVGDSTYSVEENPYYGEDDKHGRGSYRYVAAGQYYFNL